MLKNIDNVDNKLLSRSPAFVQEYIRKQADIRTIVIDGEIVSVKIVNRSNPKSKIDIRRDEMKGAEYAEIDTPSRIRKFLYSFMQYYGIRYCAFDFLLSVDGDWVFLEGNPEGQWAWLDIEGGMSVVDSFISAFRKAEVGETTVSYEKY